MIERPSWDKFSDVGVGMLREVSLSKFHYLTLLVSSVTASNNLCPYVFIGIWFEILKKSYGMTAMAE